MWTAKLRDARKNADHWDVAITYTNGTVTISKGYQLFGVTVESVKALVRSEISKFNATDATEFAMTDGETIDLTLPTPEPPPPPTAAEIARDAWFEDFRTLRQYMTLVEMGLLAATAAPVVALQTKLKANYLPAYLGRIF